MNVQHKQHTVELETQLKTKNVRASPLNMNIVFMSLLQNPSSKDISVHVRDILRVGFHQKIKGASS